MVQTGGLEKAQEPEKVVEPEVDEETEIVPAVQLDAAA